MKAYAGRTRIIPDWITETAKGLPIIPERIFVIEQGKSQVLLTPGMVEDLYKALSSHNQRSVEYMQISGFDRFQDNRSLFSSLADGS
jgi:hypothetical protein